MTSTQRNSYWFGFLTGDRRISYLNKKKKEKSLFENSFAEKLFISAAKHPEIIIPILTQLGRNLTFWFFFLEGWGGGGCHSMSTCELAFIFKYQSNKQFIYELHTRKHSCQQVQYVHIGVTWPAAAAKKRKSCKTAKEDVVGPENDLSRDKNPRRGRKTRSIVTKRGLNKPKHEQ